MYTWKTDEFDEDNGYETVKNSNNEIKMGMRKLEEISIPAIVCVLGLRDDGSCVRIFLRNVVPHKL